ncbi:MAG: hypothetical protein H7251_03880, partial [Acetobacteraceae bacterium]|nr:hypothetical protein [Acetobacteraceae bacterium]
MQSGYAAFKRLNVAPPGRICCRDALQTWHNLVARGSALHIFRNVVKYMSNSNEYMNKQALSLRQGQLFFFTTLIALFIIAAVGQYLSPNLENFLSFSLFYKQDLIFLGIIVLINLSKLFEYKNNSNNITSNFSNKSAIFICLFIVIFCWAGHYLVFEGYDLTRDEKMANFDAYIFSHGKIFWPISPSWQPFADALNRAFILDFADRSVWVSSYLPVNAGMRALVGMVADAALTGPLLVALGAVSLWRITVRLWPASPMSQLVALILYAGSSQILFTGMTA